MIPDYELDLGVSGDRSSLIASLVSIVDWDGCSGGMSRDFVFFDE